VNAKIVAITVALIFVISIVSALFIPGEEKREFIRIDRVDIRVKSVNESHVDFLFIVYMYRSEMVKNATVQPVYMILRQMFF